MFFLFRLYSSKLVTSTSFVFVCYTSVQKHPCSYLIIYEICHLVISSPSSLKENTQRFQGNLMPRFKKKKEKNPDTVGFEPCPTTEISKKLTCARKR